MTGLKDHAIQEENKGQGVFQEWVRLDGEASVRDVDRAGRGPAQAPKC